MRFSFMVLGLLGIIAFIVLFSIGGLVMRNRDESETEGREEEKH